MRSNAPFLPRGPWYRRIFMSLSYYTIVVGMVVLVVLASVLVTLGTGLMVDSGQALRAAEGLGLHDARIVAEHRFLASWNGCSDEDAAAFEVEARNADDELVQLTVCVGWPFKGATPRFR